MIDLRGYTVHAMRMEWLGTDDAIAYTGTSGILDLRDVNAFGRFLLLGVSISTATQSFSTVSAQLGICAPDGPNATRPWWLRLDNVTLSTSAPARGFLLPYPLPLPWVSGGVGCYVHTAKGRGNSVDVAAEWFFLRPRDGCD